MVQRPSARDTRIWSSVRSPWSRRGGPANQSVSRSRARAAATTGSGNAALASRLDPREFVDDQVGEPTVRDILQELAKPGRDPRSEFKVAAFHEGIHEIGDLKTGMVLEGVVTNVTKFGAFVDIGVHQDGLVHISQLSNTYVRDPSEVVSVGDVVRVKVLEVDVERRRISLSRRDAS